MKLTAAQIEEVRAPSVKYESAVYADELARIVKAKKPEGRIEQAFPGVKPQHVAHMLKGAAAASKAKVEVVVHSAYGVCVLPE